LLIEKASSGDSIVWQTPDLQLGSHIFSYTSTQYDGLLHTHREYCVVTSLDGITTIHIEGRDQMLLPGDTYVVNPGVPHRCSFGKGGGKAKGVTLLLAPELMQELCGKMNASLIAYPTIPFFHHSVRDPELVQTAQKIAGECSEMRHGFQLVIELLAKQMLIHLLRAWPREHVVEVKPKLSPQLPWVYMHRATEYMNSYGKGGFRLSDLCQVVGLSSSRFIPLFKSSAGISPHMYYNHLLVFKARRLLRVEGCSTKEIAYALGFKNVSHFCSLYHKLTGVSPRSDYAHYLADATPCHRP
jgi:AraC-like DNA-binding protein